MVSETGWVNRIDFDGFVLDECSDEGEACPVRIPVEKGNHSVAFLDHFDVTFQTIASIRRVVVYLCPFLAGYFFCDYVRATFTAPFDDGIIHSYLLEEYIVDEIVVEPF